MKVPPCLAFALSFDALDSGVHVRRCPGGTISLRHQVADAHQAGVKLAVEGLVLLARQQMHEIVPNAQGNQPEII